MASHDELPAKRADAGRYSRLSADGSTMGHVPFRAIVGLLRQPWVEHFLRGSD